MTTDLEDDVTPNYSLSAEERQRRREIKEAEEEADRLREMESLRLL